MWKIEILMYLNFEGERPTIYPVKLLHRAVYRAHLKKNYHIVGKSEKSLSLRPIFKH